MRSPRRLATGLSRRARRVARRRKRLNGRWVLVEPRVTVRGRRNITAAEGVFLRAGAIIDASDGHLTLASGATICCYSIVQTVGGPISIGPRSLIGDYCNLYGQGGLTIGADCQVASGCRFVPKVSSYDDPDKPLIDQHPLHAPIVVGDDVWFGANVVVLGGVTIGDGAVIAANSVVSRDVPSKAVAGGAPARVLFMRGERSAVRSSS